MCIASIVGSCCIRVHKRALSNLHHRHGNFLCSGTRDENNACLTPAIIAERSTINVSLMSDTGSHLR